VGSRMPNPRRLALALLASGLALAGSLGARFVLAQAPTSPLSSQSQAEADRKSAGCLSCHTQTDSRSMHAAASVRLGCTDCHGGDQGVVKAGGEGSREYQDAKRKAHVLPKNEQLWKTSANPERSYTALLEEDLAFVRFVNPGDLRAAPQACGPCHREQVRRVSKSMMTHGGMLYGAALYNNGVLSGKDPIVGESYGPDGEPRVVKTLPAPSPRRRARRACCRNSCPSRAGSWASRQPVPRLRAWRAAAARGGAARPVRGAGPA